MQIWLYCYSRCRWSVTWRLHCVKVFMCTKLWHSSAYLLWTALFAAAISERGGVHVCFPAGTHEAVTTSRFSALIQTQCLAVHSANWFLHLQHADDVKSLLVSGWFSFFLTFMQSGRLTPSVGGVCVLLKDTSTALFQIDSLFRFSHTAEDLYTCQVIFRSSHSWKSSIWRLKLLWWHRTSWLALVSQCTAHKDFQILNN